MKPGNAKRVSGTANNPYCARCYVRVGTGERHVVKEGKTYHYGCYAKAKNRAAALHMTGMTPGAQ
jgi:hypothetical protein